MSPTPSLPIDETVRRAPELLAPAGGRAQFFAALNAGADAVYLGLKAFNARARAENFTPEDLRELVPLAHAYGMKVLVTMNVLVKNHELEALVRTLSVLEEIEVDAIIVQDLALARLARRHFPGLRLHASTQMAVHNLAGVLMARDLGFRRVVLARELTATELRAIRARVPREDVELEAFCHGSLCYSYSGLCFFSGAEDARSGNRGECAYTCRQPYQILSEPGQGFLFSMRDLDTAKELGLLVAAGIDTLKIEGRKKDAQYVAATVTRYRQRLDEVLGRPTLRPAAPAKAAAHLAAHGATAPADMVLSFQRQPTSFFLAGRYHENVIDLDNASHAGVRVGVIDAVDDATVSVTTECALERFDGLRIIASGTGLAALQKRYGNEHTEFSLRDFAVSGRRAATAAAGARVTITLPDGAAPQVGDVLHKVRSAALKTRTEGLATPPPDAKPRPLRAIAVDVEVRPAGDLLLVSACASKLDAVIAKVEITVPAARPQGASTLESDVQQLFSIFGDVQLAAAALRFTGEKDWFVPRSRLKELKRMLGDAAAAGYGALVDARLASALAGLGAPGAAPAPGRKPLFAIKTDRLETLREAVKYAQAHPDFALSELVFEPKRAFLPDLDPQALAAELAALPVPVRLAFPTVIRGWDEPLLKRWFAAAKERGIVRYEVGNLGAFKLLEQWSLPNHDLSTDFTLYSLNAEATRFWRELGARRVCLSIEDDAADLKSHTARLTADERASLQAILYKDTPLFIAEACSLTALHDGCPTAKVCGYRTLEIANPKGERFFVAHESCKSVVYGKDAYSLTHALAELRAMGVAQFRLDFLTRAYDADALHRVLDAARTGSPLAGTHSANYSRTLL